MKIKTVIIGGGGHARSVIDVAKSCTDIEIAGCVDKDITGNVCGVPVLGDDGILDDLKNKGITGFFVAVGDNKLRQKLFNKALDAGLEPVNIISPYAVVSDTANIGKGVCVLHNAVVHVNAVIGDNTIINTGAIIEHDCRVGKNTHISVGAVLCGEVTIGDESLVAPKSVIRNGIKIGNNTVIGMGSAVTCDMEDNIVAYGVPAKKVRNN